MNAFSETELTSRIGACWLGKAIGGTLGGPHEGKSGPLGLAFYDPHPSGILPNDDLDLQLVWLHHLLNTGAREVAPDLLAEAWRKHVTFPFDEYGVCLRNIAYGLEGPALGATDNWFAECMGAAIRSELWACLSPGDPARAAGFAWNDAVCDHAGDGVWAEVFLAALESAAFRESDRDYLLDLALDFLPAESRVKKAISDTRRWWTERPDWTSVRSQIHQAYGEDNFTDVAANLAYTILGWIAGQGDFGKSLCIATNCGADTDCTAATLGSLLGILNPSAIPAQWSAPIGNKIVLSPQIIGMTAPADLDALTRSTLRLSELLRDHQPRMGSVAKRRPPSMGDGRTLTLTQQEGMDRSVFSRSEPPPRSGKEEVQVWPGHWIRREARDFGSPVKILRFTLTLETAQPIRLMAWSQGETALWLDGVKLDTAPSDPAALWCKLGAPSFHRGGRGIYQSASSIAAGQHEVCVAWEKSPAGSVTDLVLGCANGQTSRWLPFALAEEVQHPQRESLAKIPVSA
jgi:ADP-ribosylglycohydrolase